MRRVIDSIDDSFCYGILIVYCRGARAPIDTTINRGSANGDIFVD
jgi:hypothetical protein